MTSGAVTVRHQLTPLTALTLDVGREQDRFEFSPLRDSDSTTASVGVKLDRFALIKGSASFGYRDFQPLSPSLPAYKGTIASADLVVCRVRDDPGRGAGDARRPVFVRHQPALLPAHRRVGLAGAADRRGPWTSSGASASSSSPTGDRIGVSDCDAQQNRFRAALTAAASAITWETAFASGSTSISSTGPRPCWTGNTTASGLGHR